MKDFIETKAVIKNKKRGKPKIVENPSEEYLNSLSLRTQRRLERQARQTRAKDSFRDWLKAHLHEIIISIISAVAGAVIQAAVAALLTK